jgi:hypothetical protein
VPEAQQAALGFIRRERGRCSGGLFAKSRRSKKEIRRREVLVRYCSAIRESMRFFHRIAYYLNRLQDQINNWQFQLEQVENEVSCCDPKAI